MKLSKLADQLENWQSARELFFSEVTAHRGTEVDENGFITALILRELRHFPSEPRLDRIKNQALDFLETCASPEIAGAYGFWPTHTRPSWATQVPADADDTAIIAVELARYGRLSQQDLLQIICRVLLKQRVSHNAPLLPAWIVRGSFFTWLKDGAQKANLVDCCVNANVLGLMAFTQATHLPGYQQAISLIESGLDWAGDSPQKLNSLTPFYPHPQELYWAIKHAIECGAIHLQPVLQRFNFLFKRDAALEKAAHNSIAELQSAALLPRLSQNYPICSSAYHKVVWRCPALAILRSHVSALIQQSNEF